MEIFDKDPDQDDFLGRYDNVLSWKHQFFATSLLDPLLNLMTCSSPTTFCSFFFLTGSNWTWVLSSKHEFWMRLRQFFNLPVIKTVSTLFSFSVFRWLFYGKCMTHFSLTLAFSGLVCHLLPPLHHSDSTWSDSVWFFSFPHSPFLDFSGSLWRMHRLERFISSLSGFHYCSLQSALLRSVQSSLGSDTLC